MCGNIKYKYSPYFKNTNMNTYIKNSCENEDKYISIDKYI